MIWIWQVEWKGGGEGVVGSPPPPLVSLCAYWEKGNIKTNGVWSRWLMRQGTRAVEGSQQQNSSSHKKMAKIIMNNLPNYISGHFFLICSSTSERSGGFTRRISWPASAPNTASAHCVQVFYDVSDSFDWKHSGDINVTLIKELSLAAGKSSEFLLSVFVHVRLNVGANALCFFSPAQISLDNCSSFHVRPEEWRVK